MNEQNRPATQPNRLLRTHRRPAPWAACAWLTLTALGPAATPLHAESPILPAVTTQPDSPWQMPPFDFDLLEPAITVEDLQRHVELLCHEALQGRLTATPGERLATEHVARLFAREGLEPAGAEGFFDGFNMRVARKADAGCSLLILLNNQPRRQPLRLDKDWRPLAMSTTGKFEPAPVVFVGYGLHFELPPTRPVLGRKDQTAPPQADSPEDAPAEPSPDDQSPPTPPAASRPATTQPQPADRTYDSYAGADLTGKWALILRDGPQNTTPSFRRAMRDQTSIVEKVRIAERAGAAGVILVTPPGHPRLGGTLADFASGRAGSASIPVIAVDEDIVAAWFTAGDSSLQGMVEALKSGEPVAPWVIPDLRLGTTIELTEQVQRGRNVLARLPAAHDRGLPPVVIGAHVDHLGPGPEGVRDRRRVGQIHRGADDNASGTAVLMELASFLAAEKREGRFAPDRDLIFAAWSGEELGLYGSTDWVRRQTERHAASQPATTQPTPAASRPASVGALTGHIHAYVNLDMVGRLREKLDVQGLGSSPQWRPMVDQLAGQTELALRLQDSPFLPTDSMPFYRAGVPVIVLFTGLHAEYHTPDDTPDTLNYPGMVQVAQVVVQIVKRITPEGSDLPYQGSARRTSAAAGPRPFLGTVPDMTADGVVLAEVTEAGPAAAAGLRPGDRIVSLGGSKIEDLSALRSVLDGLSIGEETSISVVRGTVEMTFRITPASRSDP